jgi:transcriptional regulator with XRE-family HTH domain
MANTYTKPIGKHIRKFREEHNMTREVFAGEIGVSPMTVYRWETTDEYFSGFHALAFKALMELVERLSPDHSLLRVRGYDSTSKIRKPAPKAVAKYQRTTKKRTAVAKKKFKK